MPRWRGPEGGSPHGPVPAFAYNGRLQFTDQCIRTPPPSAQGFPTIKLLYVDDASGNIKSADYNGGRAAKDLVNWALDKVGCTAGWLARRAGSGSSELKHCVCAAIDTYIIICLTVFCYLAKRAPCILVNRPVTWR